MIKLRSFPYPYKAMLAICSDLDETPDSKYYREIMRFLNTNEDTTLGPGAGLEIGNSIYFDMPENQFAYWNTDDNGREMVRTLIKSGHIDCLHSYGDLAQTREHVSRAINELEKYSCKIEVWVDHRKSPTNFGHDITSGSGDIIGSRAYHADISTKFGIRYVWRGRTTGLIGQNAPINFMLFAKMFNMRNPIISGRTLSKEAAKVFLGYRDHPRWQMHAANSVYRVGTLRDENKIVEFMRADPYYGGQSKVDTGQLIDQVLTKRNLDMLVKRNAVWIHYTHLGKLNNSCIPFRKPLNKAFYLLAEYHNNGKILVTTTQRLLQYLVTRDNLHYNTEIINNTLCITIDAINDPIKGNRVPSNEELQGITFEIEGIKSVKLYLYGKLEILDIWIKNHDGKTFVGIPWHSLVFPDI